MKKIALSALILISLTSCMEAANNSRKKENTNNRDGKTPTTTPAMTTTMAETQKSFIYRTRGMDQITHNELARFMATDSLPIDYRTIPDELSDLDSQVITALKPSVDCGDDDSLQSVSEMMSDCSDKNKLTSSWNGKINGISGEGKWSLVYFKNGVMFWFDENTSQVWSPLIDSGNWSAASGANAADDEFICNRGNSILKDFVKFRLPNRNEYLMADLNGARFVLSNLDTVTWTATSDDNQSNAWAISQENGVLQLVDKDTKLDIRCIGTIIK